jgi:hypothetical protein
MRRQVDHAQAAREQHRRELGGRGFRQREEHGIGGEGRGVQRHHGAVPDLRE